MNSNLEVEIRFCVWRKGTEVIGVNNYNSFDTLLMKSVISRGLGGRVLDMAQLTLYGVDAHRGPDADFAGVSK